MPGVPSGRGCSECRRAKKKCDQQQPCARCTRLKLSCVGSGERRFKFVEPTLCRKGSSSSSEQSRSVTPWDNTRQSSLTLTSSPNSEVLILASALASTINLSVDERFNLVGTYGPFLEYLPSRLGLNKALDAAVAVLVEVHSVICIRSGIVPVTAISKHSDALQQLRLALNIPERARATETLAAAMILCICEGFITGGNCSFGNSHVAGMSRLLKYRGDILNTSSDPFEKILAATLRGPVAFEALWNDRAIFTDEEWHDFTQNYSGDGPESRIMFCISRVPVFLRRSKVWRKSPHADPTFTHDVTATYETIVLAANQVSDLTLRFQQKFADGLVESTLFFKTNFALIRLYPLALSIVAVLGCLLTATNPLYPGLQDELDRCAIEVLASAQQMDKYRPLGSSAMPLCLAMCWTGTGNLEVRAEIARVSGEYMRDYPAPGYADTFIASLAPLERKLKLQD